MRGLVEADFGRLLWTVTQTHSSTLKPLMFYLGKVSFQKENVALQEMFVMIKDQVCFTPHESIHRFGRKDIVYCLPQRRTESPP